MEDIANDNVCCAFGSFYEPIFDFFQLCPVLHNLSVTIWSLLLNVAMRHVTVSDLGD